MSLPRTSLRRRPLLALIILILLLLVGYTARAVGDHHHRQLTTVTLSTLPPQARDTVSLIQRHGPLRYSKDGAIYQNAEHELPAEPAGYYHEYTVITPNSPDRGTRRIVTGAAGQFYYTGDHYASFQRIDLSG